MSEVINGDKIKVKLLFAETRLSDAHNICRQLRKENENLKKTIETLQATFPVGDPFPKRGKLRSKKNGYCFLCASLSNVSQHHVIPRSYGGVIKIDLCGPCHQYVHQKFTNLQLVGMTWKQVRDELLKAPIPAPKSMKEKK